MTTTRPWPATAVLLPAAALVACADGVGDGGAARTDATRTPEASVSVSSRPDAAARDSVNGYDPRRTRVFRCVGPAGETFRFEVRPRDGRVEVRLPARFGPSSRLLPPVPADSGARYRGPGTLVWERGDVALLRADGETFRGCTRDRGGWVWAEARRRGVGFRASGDEPGWYLELTRGDSLRLVYDYGERELHVPTPEPEVAGPGGTVVYRSVAGGRDLRVTVREEPCVAMSGTEFPVSVTVEVGEGRYTGCGRRLQPPP